MQDANKDHTVDRFVGVTDDLDEKLKLSTIGLVTLDDFVKTRENLEEQERQAAAKTLADKRCVTPPTELIGSAPAKKKKEKKKSQAKLSFADEEEEPQPGPSKRGRSDDCPFTHPLILLQS